jgi:hydrogenase maturation protease
VPPRVLVACIGNIFLGDDAFGVEVARELVNRRLPEGAQVVDFGIRSYDLAYALMEDWDLVIMVDAVPRGGQPGTVYVIEPEWPGADDAPPALDAHTMNPVAVLRLVAMLGGSPSRRTLVVGCEPTPADTEDQETMELSEPVRAAIPEAAAVVEELVASVPAAIPADKLKEAS